MPELYSTVAEIPSFGGINQTGDGYNMSMRFARELENVDVTGGAFRQMRRGSILTETPYSETVTPEGGEPTEFQLTGDGIATLAILHRRYTHETFKWPESKDILVAVTFAGYVLVKPLGTEDDWDKAMPGSISRPYFDWVSYEMNLDGYDFPIDVLVFSNAYNGMYVLMGDNLSFQQVSGVPAKFGCICRHNERIWGSGIIDDPDKLMYSAPYSLTNWAYNAETPEDGGGDILCPNWDGDRFLALREYGSQLLAFKNKAVWRVVGSNPDEFYLRQQYGRGARCEDTISISASYCFMLGDEGIMRYDGETVAEFRHPDVKDIMLGRVNWQAVDKQDYDESQYSTEFVNRACAIQHSDIYYLALPLDGSTENNAVLIYNPHEGSFSLMTGVHVQCWLEVGDRLFYASREPGHYGRIRELTDAGETLPVLWRSGWQDLGMKSSVKSTFTVYFTCDAPTAFPLNLGLRTEKKLKLKTLTVKPGKPCRIHMNVQGRYFQLELSSNSVSPFQLNGGIRMDLELDPD